MVLWLERPPLLRWVAAVCLVAASAWFELGPPPSTEMTFLAVDIGAGTILTEDLVERRSVTDPGFATVEPEGFAVTDLAAGEPLVASMIAHATVPDGWLVISVAVPDHARPGKPATAVILPGGPEDVPVQFPAVVVEAGSADPFGTETGALAVPPQWLGQAAAAAGQGRLMIGVGSGVE